MEEKRRHLHTRIDHVAPNGIEVLIAGSGFHVPGEDSPHVQNVFHGAELARFIEIDGKAVAERQVAGYVEYIEKLFTEIDPHRAVLHEEAVVLPRPDAAGVGEVSVVLLDLNYRFELVLLGA